MPGKWEAFQRKTYRLEDLGRPALFYLPSHKLKIKQGDTTIEDSLHAFLLENFDAFTTTLIPQFGVWRNDNNQIAYDECRQYRVSFPGKERIPLLLEKLSEIAKTIDEKCIYVETGQYACLVYPN